jgi:hypothetical protein
MTPAWLGSELDVLIGTIVVLKVMSEAHCCTSGERLAFREATYEGMRSLHVGSRDLGKIHLEMIRIDTGLGIPPSEDAP